MVRNSRDAWGFFISLIASFILGWAVSQPDPYVFKLKLMAHEDNLIVCEQTHDQCKPISIDLVENLIYYHNLMRSF